MIKYVVLNRILFIYKMNAVAMAHPAIGESMNTLLFTYEQVSISTVEKIHFENDVSKGMTIVPA
jgi:hypothetical protein